jgi:hypothetical protein
MKSENLIKMYLKSMKKVRAEMHDEMYNTGKEKINKIIETLEWVLNKE